MPLVIAVAGAVVFSVLLLAGAFYYLAKSGRLNMPFSIAVAKAPPAEDSSFHSMVLEPMVANLADADGRAYLRLGLTLRVATDQKKEKAKDEQPKEGKGIGEAETAVRDVALEVLGHQTSEALLAADGKEKLKLQLKQALGQRDSELKVADIFFTEFLVQR
ncbi:flagellar basal body-associated FliL family protein [Granulicella sp. dw_53]|uniref:flagellar basal body-associated FliL family protein n=1 Tax=Granulicella sp. dw_53 TaxID=2719792 RepID=UPI001BD542BA